MLVLLVEDNATVRRNIERMFSRYGDGDFEVRTIDDLTCDVDDSPDVVLLDPGLGTTTWDESVHIARNRWPRAPIVVLTASEINGEANALREAGAASCYRKQDVLTNDGFPVLLRALRRALGSQGHTAGEVAVSRAIRKAEASPIARKVVAWILSGIGLVGGGGGVAAWQFLQASDSSAANATATRDLEREFDLHVVTESGKIDRLVDAIAAQTKAAEKADEKLEKVLGKIERLTGYVRAKGQDGEP